MSYVICHMSYVYMYVICHMYICMSYVYSIPLLCMKTKNKKKLLYPSMRLKKMFVKYFVLHFKFVS